MSGPSTAREVARQQGKSLDTMVRELLERLAGTRAGPETADERIRLMRKQGGRSGRRRIAREDAYRRRP